MYKLLNMIIFTIFISIIKGGFWHSLSHTLSLSLSLWISLDVDLFVCMYMDSIELCMIGFWGQSHEPTAFMSDQVKLVILIFVVIEIYIYIYMYTLISTISHPKT